jgi:DNA-binding transcriptional regulator YhcF (GntR family)
MNALDPGDHRPASQQIADVLRAAILTRKIAPGERLPSGPRLAARYGVAKMTVQQAINALRDEGLVVSRKGSGVYARERTERPVGLRPHLEQAFEASAVTIDFVGFSGETLHGAISEPLDRIREGRLRPESLKLRLLVPDTSIPWSLPARVADLADSPAFRNRMHRISDRHTHALTDSVNELSEMGLVPGATAAVRTFPSVPLFKLYVINNSHVFFGYYPVRQHVVDLDGERTPMWDLMGKDAILFHHVAESDKEAMSTQIVEESAAWFESVWDSVAREVELS